MKLHFNGHACFTITLDNGFTFVTDPFDASGRLCPSHRPCRRGDDQPRAP